MWKANVLFLNAIGNFQQFANQRNDQQKNDFFT